MLGFLPQEEISSPLAQILKGDRTGQDRTRELLLPGCH